MENSYLKAVINCDTNEITHEPMTEAEILEFEKAKAEVAQQQTLREQDAAAKEALRESAKAKLTAGKPLTEDEAAVLVIQWYANNNIPLPVCRPSYQHDHR